MMKYVLSLGISLLFMTALAQQSIRFMWYADSTVQTDTMTELIEQFVAENPDIEVVLDVVPYATITDNLELLLSTGEGPDIARVTNLGGLAKHYLDISSASDRIDSSYWEANYGPYLDWLDPDNSGEVHGMQLELTVTGPYVNTTYFELAGVDMPQAGATWDDWAAASREVAAAVTTPDLEIFALAMDPTAHRLAGPAISQGAKFLNDEGRPSIDDEGFRIMAQKLIDWHEDGTILPDSWKNIDGARAPTAFENGEVVMLMSGSWLLGRYATNIADKFDWTAVANPCGPAACSGMPGGSAVVAFKDTKHPEAVAKFLNFLSNRKMPSIMQLRLLPSLLISGWLMLVWIIPPMMPALKVHSMLLWLMYPI
ncbi:MAG: extracellular solute-binding protein [Deinococcales bacterium]